MVRAARNALVAAVALLVLAPAPLHGAYDRFVEMLKAVDIVDGGLRRAAGSTHVVQLGDLLDRGDDSRTAMDLVLDILARASAPAAPAPLRP